MATFTWTGDPEGRTFEMLTKATFAEIAWIEQHAKSDWDDLSSSLKGLAVFLLSMRRAQVMLSWADGMAMSPTDFDVEDADGEDPQTPGAEAGSDDSSGS